MNTTVNRLRYSIAYLAGHMEKVQDHGIQWRQDIKPWLWARGIGVFDPCDKPIDVGREDIEDHQRRRALKAAGQLEQVGQEMRGVRCVDLRGVDLSSFLIVNLYSTIPTCGTHEEITTANDQKKPILVHLPDGLSSVPDWLTGKVPHEMMFDSWDKLKAYLADIDEHGVNVCGKARWRFFDYNKIYGRNACSPA